MGSNGCVSLAPGPHAPELQLASQSSERHQCGPSTLASVLAFHGKPVSESTITEAIYSPTAGGVLISDLAWYAREVGFRTEIRNGTLEDLIDHIDQAQPPIVLLDLGVAGIQRPHFTAVTGVTEDGIFLIGTGSEDDYIRRNLFKRQWQRAGNQYLVVLPESP